MFHISSSVWLTNRPLPERFEKQGSFRYGRVRGAAAKNRCLQRTPRFITGTMGLDQDSAHNSKFWSNSSHIPSHILEILVQLVPHSVTCQRIHIAGLPAARGIEPTSPCMLLAAIMGQEAEKPRTF